MAKHYAAILLTGGASGALDKINGALLEDRDTARVTIKDTGRTYFYHLDATSGAAESSPDVIAPDTSAGSKRWILSKVEVDASTLGTAASKDMADSAEALAGAPDKVMDAEKTHEVFSALVGGKTSVPRQAILTGKVDADGLPAFLAISGNDVQIVASESDPLILSFASGFGAQGGIDYFAEIKAVATILNASFIMGVRNFIYAERAADGAITYGVTDVPLEISGLRQGMPYPNTTAYLGDMIVGGGLVAAFNGGIEAAAACASKATATVANVGMDFGVARVLRGAEVFGSSDAGFSSVTTPSTTVEMLGSNTNDIATGVQVATQTITDANGASVRLWNINQATAYRYYWIRVTSASSGSIYVAEVRWLASNDHLDLNTFKVKGQDGTQRTRLYLGYVDVSGAGVLSGLYCYAIGTHAVRAVNGGNNIVTGQVYEVVNPFGARVNAEFEVFVQGDWHRLEGGVIWNPGNNYIYGSRQTRRNAMRIRLKTGTQAILALNTSESTAHVTEAPARVIVQRAF